MSKPKVPNWPQLLLDGAWLSDNDEGICGNIAYVRWTNRGKEVVRRVGPSWEGVDRLGWWQLLHAGKSVMFGSLSECLEKYL